MLGTLGSQLLALWCLRVSWKRKKMGVSNDVASNTMGHETTRTYPTKDWLRWIGEGREGEKVGGSSGVHVRGYLMLGLQSTDGRASPDAVVV